MKQAAAAGGKPAAEVAWQTVAPLDALMQQVPIVNNSLRRGLDPNRFKRQQKQTAGQAATLAAIAQAASFDLSDADDFDRPTIGGFVPRHARRCRSESTLPSTPAIPPRPRQAPNVWLKTVTLATRSFVNGK